MAQKENEISTTMAKWIYYLVSLLVWLILINMYVVLIDYNENYVLLWSIVNISIVVCIWLMYYKTTIYNRFAMEQRMNRKHLDAVQSVLFILIGVLCVFIKKDVWNLLTNYSTTFNDKNIEQNAGLQVADFISNAMVSPIIEEVVFRGYFFILAFVISIGIIKLINKKRTKPITNKITFRLAISIYIVGAIIFALCHGVQNVSEFALYFSSGLMYSVLFIITKRLYIVIAIHMLNNTMATMDMLYVDGNNQTSWYNVFSYLLGITIIIVVLVFYPKIKRQFKNFMSKVQDGQ
ncbi:CPBP family intramembrane glutamic endopeptidase [Mammaliicoccus lentus]|uniref:CPBP family intramembrane glutamic endopeptidase n=1 Tax=Mammaliicoccus lentus TaxID=42858 RepID=UPI00107231EF|nr:CPBP family intramembrane glutamic endopeptidase [Mammaliicoccus lentus]MBF0795186.1 CPBP family intramembrane metalloprotease [Mammaliicoccus lentus]TFV14588.1 CPBP family intramembrane metalloprotease [Mammaliicoccus lentus]